MEYTQQDIEDNLGLVYKIAWGMQYLKKSGLVEQQDLINDGTIGLIKALKKFDPTCGFKFSTYAVKVIKGSILDGIEALHADHMRAKRSGVPSGTISMEGLRTEDGEYLSIHDRGGYVWKLLEDLHNRERSRQLQAFLGTLTPILYQTMQLRLQGLTFSEVGEQMGVSRQRIEQRQKKVVEKAKQHFPQEP
jgi:RNA polymerase sigma factor (sigma-70 family)